ncbi:MAG: GTP-binding protein LepA [Aurantibacter sp.]
MTTYIAQFIAKHRIVPVEQNSVFTWRQESGEIDESLLVDKIKRESSVPFFQLVAGKNFHVGLDDIVVTILKTEIF